MKYNMLRVVAFVTFSMIFFSCKSQYQLLLEGRDVQAKYEHAMELFEREKFQKAASMFESINLDVKGTAQEDTVQFYTALSHYENNDVFTAEAAFETFVSVFPLSPFALEARYLYIDCLYSQTLRYELDQSMTHRALGVIAQYIAEYPESEYVPVCEDIISELRDRLDRKTYENAKIYYTIENYKSAHYALRNVLKDNADNRYREDILYYTAMASYKYALNSLEYLQYDRFMTFIDDYYNFVGEYKDSKYRRELDNLFERAQKITGRDNKTEITQTTGE